MLGGTMNRQMVHYKITLTGPGNGIEIRYLAMETISYHNYLYFVRKLIALFPVLKDLPFSVNWKDKEGDIVRICSDDELTIAMDEMKSDPVKKIFIIVKEQGNNSILHPNVSCDGCDHPIIGFRYKCLICDDYELCSDCERSQTHSEHPMIRIPKPLTPNTPYEKQFTRDIPKISHHIERLFHYTGKEVCRSSNQKVLSDSKPQFKFCHNKAHNIVANLLVEKLIKHKIETSVKQQKPEQENHSCQPEPSPSTDVPVRNESQDVSDFMCASRSLSFDVNSGSSRRQVPSEEDEAALSSCERPRLGTCSSLSALNFSSACVEGATTSEELAVASNIINEEIPEIDAAPIPADPTPALQAQLTPICAPNTILTPTVLTPVPVSNALMSSKSILTKTVPLSRLADAPTQDSFNIVSHDHSYYIPAYMMPPPIEDDGSLDNSWSVVSNEPTSVASSDSISTIESLETTPVSTPQSTESTPQPIDSTPQPTDSTPQPTDSSLAQKFAPYEETIKMLHTLGFEKKEWVNQVVEFKKGDIKEVLKFLSPVRKPSTNLHH